MKMLVVAAILALSACGSRGKFPRFDEHDAKQMREHTEWVFPLTIEIRNVVDHCTMLPDVPPYMVGNCICPDHSNATSGVVTTCEDARKARIKR